MRIFIILSTFFSLLSFQLYSMEVEITSLTEKEGIYYLNNKSFSGELLRQITGENNFKITDQYENGKIKMEIPFSSDKFNGEVKFFDETGKLKFSQNFEYGEPKN